VTHHPEAISLVKGIKTNGDVVHVTEAETKESLANYEQDIVALSGN
jgi:hypothetical protein